MVVADLIAMIVYFIILCCFAVICADGNYHKFVFNTKGECTREVSANFLEMTDGKS